MFKSYRVKLNIKGQFAAGIPKNPEALLKFLEVREPTRKPEGGQPVEELAEEIEGQIYSPEQTPEAALTTTFKTRNGVLVYESRCVKAHIKDCTLILSKGIEKVRGLKSAVANRVQVEPDFLPLTRDGRPLTKPDDKEIRPITVMMRQGPRTAVKIVEYVNCPEMEFTLVVLDDGIVTLKLLDDIFTYGGRIKGVGQDRGIGFGRYSYAITEEN